MFASDGNRFVLGLAILFASAVLRGVQDQGRQEQGVGLDDPLRVSGRCSEAFPYLRKRDVGYRAVDKDYCRPDSRRREHPGTRRLLARRVGPPRAYDPYVARRITDGGQADPLSGRATILCSERRAFGLQELSLLGRGLPAQDPIPVREPPEPLDDVPVPRGVGGYVGRPRLVREQPEKLDGAPLVLPVLAVHERHVQEHPLEGGEFPVQRVLDGVPGGLERRSVGGVGASVAAEHVAGELVEHDDERQAAPRIIAPAVEVAGGGLLVETGELVRDPSVELGIFTEPLVAELAVAGLAFAPEPEVEYFLGPTRHGLSLLLLHRGG